MLDNVKNFYELDAWKKGHALVLDVYKITKNFPAREQFGVTSQSQRAVTSITANIAEGFGRFYFKDKIRFYYQSRGSVSEVQNFLLIARDLGYIDNDTCKDIGMKSNEVNRLINGLIGSVGNKSSSSENDVNQDESRDLWLVTSFL